MSQRRLIVDSRAEVGIATLARLYHRVEQIEYGLIVDGSHSHLLRSPPAHVCDAGRVEPNEP